MKKTILEALVLLVVVGVALSAMYFLFSDQNYGLALQAPSGATCQDSGICKVSTGGGRFTCFANGKQEACPSDASAVALCGGWTSEDGSFMNEFNARSGKHLAPQCVDGILYAVTPAQQKLNADPNVLTKQGTYLDVCRCA